MKTNRLTPYETGWLTMLIRQRICTEAEARAAQNRVAIEAVAELDRLRRGLARRKKRKKSGDEE